MKLLRIDPLGQRDPRWANQRLGTVNGATIGSDGCVITCHSMLMTFHGFPMTPDVLDNFLTDNGLYYDATGNGPADDDLWIPSNISKVNGKMRFINTIYCYNSPAPIDKIKEAIDRNQPPTLWLMNNGVAHNVLAVGYDGNQIYVNDPWRGDRVRIDERWGDSAAVILSIDFYDGPMPDETVAVPKTDFEGMVFKSTQHDKTCKTWEFSDPRNTTAEQVDEKVQKTINAYKGQATSAQAAEAETATKLAAAQQEVKNRIEQISRLDEELIKQEEVHKAELEALKNLPNPNENLIAILKGQVEDYKSKYDAAMKDKGRALNELATVKTELSVCQKGTNTKTLWELILSFLSQIRVQTK